MLKKHINDAIDALYDTKLTERHKDYIHKCLQDAMYRIENPKKNTGRPVKRSAIECSEQDNDID